MIVISWPFFTLLIALLFAFLGQALFSDRRFYSLALASYAVAIAAMFFYAWLERRRPQSSLRLPLRVLLLALLVVATIVACMWLEVQDRAYLAQIALWAGSMALLVVALIPSQFRWRAWLGGLGVQMRRNWPEIVFVVAVLVLGFFLRAYRLETIPPGGHGDEGEFGMVALRILQGESQKMGPFFTAGPFLHPNGFHYMQALSMWIWGVTLGGLRMISAICGALTLLPVFLFSRRLFGRWAAIFATFWLAVSPWHIQFSRLAWNEVTVPLTCLIGLYFLYRGVESAKPLHYCLAGLAFGVGLQIGSSSRAYTLVVAAAWVCYLLVLRRGFLRQQYMNLVVLAVAFLVAFAPLALHYTQFGWKRLMFDPVGNKSLLSNLDRAYANYHTDSLLHVLRIQAEKALLVFNYYPDAGFFDFTREPVLDKLAASLFVLGLAYSVFNWKNGKYALMVFWLGASLAGNILSTDPPQSHRLTGISPAPYIYAAITVDLMRTELTHYLWFLAARWRAVSLAVGLVLLLGAVGYINVHTYFVRYETKWPWRNVTEVAREIKRLGTDYAVVLVSDLPFGHGTIRFIALGVEGQEARSFQDLLNIEDDSAKDVAFIVTPSHQNLLPFITQQYPGGRSKKTEQYVTYIVSRERIRDHAARQDLSGAGLLGRYYTNADFAGAPAAERTDLLLAFRDFHMPPNMPFSVQWVGALQITEPGIYRLRLLANGEVSLYLDGWLVLSGQEAHEAWYRSEPLELAAGKHALQLRYRYQKGWQLLELHWTLPDGQEMLVPSEALRR